MLMDDMVILATSRDCNKKFKYYLIIVDFLCGHWHSQLEQRFFSGDI